MKILVLLSSPRKNANTSALVSSYINGVKSNNQNYDIETIRLEDNDINGCRGCFACQKGKIDTCVTSDDMISIYNKILIADVIVLATPIYTFAMTAQMKAMMDRLFAISNRLVGKKVVTLSVYGDTNRETSGVKNHLTIVKSLCEYTGMKHIANYDTSSAFIPVKDNNSIKKEVFDMGISLN